jgi:hypothetical protein
MIINLMYQLAMKQMVLLKIMYMSASLEKKMKVEMREVQVNILITLTDVYVGVRQMGAQE